MKARVNTILIHTLFLAVFFYAPIFIRPDFNKRINPENWRMAMVINNLLAAVVFYANYYFLIPRYIFPGKFLNYILNACLLLIICLSIPIISNFILYKLFDITPLTTVLDIAWGPVVIFGMSFALSFALRFSGEWQRMREEKTEMQAEMRAAELMILKKQLNPHFFFNTLNGIYAMIIKKSPLAPKAVLQLSNMMRYVLYDSDCNNIELSKEVKYIADYIEMQKMRLTGNNHIHFSVSGEMESIHILPLIFIPFVENAFKYGISSDNETNIVIEIANESNALTFTCINDIISSKHKPVHSGIGITNTKKRLDMTYPGKYELATLLNENKYIVKLNIDLSC